MTTDMKLKLGSLDLGVLPILDASALPDLATNGLHNFLVLARQKGEFDLRYRHISTVESNANSNYELSLGAIIAASAVVFSTPLAAAPSQVATLLLVRPPNRAENGTEQLQAVLVNPSRDGNIDTARLADGAQQDALPNAVADDAVELVPVQAETANMAALIRHALLSEANIDVRLPVAEEELPTIELKLPKNLTFDEDGVFYFRDILDGGHDVLLIDENEFTDLQFEISIFGGVFYQLEDDEEFIASYLTDGETGADDDTTTKIAFHLSDIEASMSSLAVIANPNAENVRIEVTVYLQDQLIFEETVIFDVKPPVTHELDAIDVNQGLPDDDLDVFDKDGECLQLGETAFGDQDDEDLSSILDIL